jgi:hypothetical protein
MDPRIRIHTKNIMDPQNCSKAWLNGSLIAMVQWVGGCWPCCCLAMAAATRSHGCGGKRTPDFTRYTTLADFGYGFNEAGELRQLAADGTLTQRPFHFEVKSGNKSYNQRHYDALGDVLTEEIYRMLEEAGLYRLPLPVYGVDADSSMDSADSVFAEEEEGKGAAGSSFVFASEGYESKASLLVLIHGSGVVRAGQWARRLIVNNNLGETRYRQNSKAKYH